MRSTFSRTFFPAALLLLIALLIVGISFQLLVKNYLVSQAYEELENDGGAIASLAAAYYADGSLSARAFLVNLNFAAQISEADAVIFDSNGKLLLCSDSPMGCEHQGWSINQDYIHRVISAGTARHTGIFSGLYNETRYVVSVPITEAKTGNAVGIVMVSKGKVIAAGKSGKFKTASSMIGLCVLMAFPTIGWLAWVIVGMIVFTTVYSGVEYFIQNWNCLWDE